MVLVILLVLALFVVQTLLPGRFREAPTSGGQSKIAENLGPRDQMRPLTVTGQRAQRALTNMQEALPVFLGLALMNLIVAPEAGLAVTGAWVFLIARIVYVPLYLGGVPVARTLAWVASWVGLILMLVPLLERL
jgi:uncharacterized MAPEG superfamily protein